MSTDVQDEALLLAHKIYRDSPYADAYGDMGIAIRFVGPRFECEIKEYVGKMTRIHSNGVDVPLPESERGIATRRYRAMTLEKLLDTVREEERFVNHPGHDIAQMRQATISRVSAQIHTAMDFIEENPPIATRIVEMRRQSPYSMIERDERTDPVSVEVVDSSSARQTTGRVVDFTDQHLLQDVGRGVVLRHYNLNLTEVFMMSELVAVGDLIRVSYDGSGRGSLTNLSRDQQHEQGVERDA